MPRLAFGIAVPSCGSFFAPGLGAIPIQLVAYLTSVINGAYADRSRNLARRVMAE